MSKLKQKTIVESGMKVQMIMCIVLFCVYLVSKFVFPSFHLALIELYNSIAKSPPIYNLEDVRKISQQIISFVNNAAQ